MKPHFLARSLYLFVFGVAALGLWAETVSARGFDGKQPTRQSNVQFSLSTSSDDLNVYGNAVLSEVVPSNLSYRITITVTSPSGRINTVESDWSPAPLSFSGGLSFGMESGTYSVQARYDGRSGTYDEYGNFSPTGAKTTASTADQYLVRPIISVGSVSPTSLAFDRILPSTLSSTAYVYTSADFPADTSFDFGTAGTGPGPTFYSVVGGRMKLKIGTGTPGTPKAVTFAYEPVPATFPLAAVATGEQLMILSVWKRTGTNPQNGEPVYRELIENTDYRFRVKEMGITLTLGPPGMQGGGGSGGGQQPDTCFCAGSAGLIPPGSGVCAGGSIPACPMGSFSGGSPGVCCWYNSPIVLDINGDGFSMTSNANGVRFDISGRGYATRVSWTAPDSDDAWLVLDRNENGRIDDGQEMFGDACPQPAGQAPRNGFSALAMYDQASFGGNGDGKITRRDQVFKKLRLWQDRNHNGVSEAEELSSLPALDVVAIRLDFQESRRTDSYGNKFKYWAKVRDRADARVGRRAWDVFLVVSTPGD